MANNSNENIDKEQHKQPRQPQNLQGLIKFAIEAGSHGEDCNSANNNFQPLDAERRAFLEKTLKSLTIDVIEILQKCISTLVSNKERTNQNEKECVTALETIQDYVDNLDTANDFFKIGGFSILPVCLSSPWASVRSHGCELIADLAQNNPFCQDNLLKSDVLPDLLRLLSDNEVVSVKALYAVSCMVRNYDPGLEWLLDNGGLGAIVQAIGSKDFKCANDKLRTKASFLLRALCLQNNKIRSELINLDAVEQLSLALKEANESREHIMSALLSIICSAELEESAGEKFKIDEIGTEALQRTKNQDLDLKNTLETFIKESSNKPEFQEVFEYSKKLQHLIFDKSK